MSPYKNLRAYSYDDNQGGFLYWGTVIVVALVAFAAGYVVGQSRTGGSARGLVGPEAPEANEELKEHELDRKIQEVIAEQKQQVPPQYTFHEVLAGKQPEGSKQVSTAAPGSPTELAAAAAAYAVQVGAFQQETQAQELQRRLKQRGYDAYVHEAQVEDRGTWFRVWVGKSKTREEAESLAKRLSSQERVSTLVVSAKR